MQVMSPAAAAAEEVAGAWLLELLGLPARRAFGFTTGAQMANFTGLAAARHAVLKRAGWDVERDGLQGAPRVRVLAGEQSHATVYLALRYLGLGAPRQIAGRRRGPDAGRRRSRRRWRTATGPAIVCAQAGNVNSGAFDPFGAIADIARPHGAWLHVDGAFGLWAAAQPGAAAPRRRRRARRLVGDRRHKWLNVPYDSGIVFVRDPAAHARRDDAAPTSYLIAGAASARAVPTRCRSRRAGRAASPV